MRRLAEIGAFLGLSAVVHAGVMAGLGDSLGGPEGQGAGGTDRISLQAAPESLAALAEHWTAPPEAATLPETMPPPTLTEAPPRPNAETAPLPIPHVSGPMPAMPDRPPMPETPAPNLSRPTPPTLPSAMPVPVTEPATTMYPQADAAPTRSAVPRLSAPEPVLQPTPDRTLSSPPGSSDLAAISSPRPARRPDDLRRTSPASTPQPARVATGRGDGATQGAAAQPPQTAPAPTAAQRRSLMAQWGGQIMARIERSRPRVRGTGQVGVNLRLSPDGQLSGLSVARSSGDPALDAAALSAVRGAGRFPAAPEGLTEASYSFSVPIRFR